MKKFVAGLTHGGPPNPSRVSSRLNIHGVTFRQCRRLANPLVQDPCGVCRRFDRGWLITGWRAAT